MENKQLFEKQGNGYNPFFPIVRLEDIIETISDKSIQWIFNNYNHIYVEYSESREITRNKVPQLLRRSGLWISYNNGKDNITEHYIGENTNVNNYVEWTSDDNWKKFDELTIQDKSITYQHLSDALRQLVAGGNTITNFPDEEDITSDGTVLSFKDRDYEPNTFSGLGRVILRKNLKVVDGQVKNILTQNMIDKENTIYEIRYDFDLNGAEITVPEGCVLDFQGGSFKNGGIIGCNSSFTSINKCFENIKFKGSFLNSFNIEHFGAVGDGIYDNTIIIQQCLESIKNSASKSLFIPNGTFLITDTLDLYSDLYVVGEGNNSCIKMYKNKYSETPVSKYIFKLSLAKNVIIDKLKLDGGATTQSKIPHDADGAFYVICFNPHNDYDVDNVSITNCHICNGWNGGVQSIRAALDKNTPITSNIRISGTVFENMGFHGVGMNRWFNSIVTNCSFINVGRTNMYNNAGGGLGVDVSIGCEDIIVSNNIVNGATGGFKAETHVLNDGTIAASKGVHFINNIIKNLRIEEQFRVFYGIRINGVDCKVIGNTIESSSGHGITLGSYASNCQIVNNTIAKQTRAGIEIAGGHHYIEGNKLYGGGENGIQIQSSNNVIANNEITGFNADGVRIFFGSNNVIKDNKIYDNKNNGINTTPISSNVSDMVFVSNNICYNTEAGEQTRGILVHDTETVFLDNNHCYNNKTSDYLPIDVRQYGNIERRREIDCISLSMENKVFQVNTNLSNSIFFLEIVYKPYNDLENPKVIYINGFVGQIGESKRFRYLSYNTLGNDNINNYPKIYLQYVDNKLRVLIETSYQSTTLKVKLSVPPSDHRSYITNYVVTDYVKQDVEEFIEIYNNYGTTEYRNSLVINTNKYKGFSFFDTTLNKPLWLAPNGRWIDAQGNRAEFLTSGKFENKPTDPFIGYRYFCTDKKMEEGNVFGMCIYHVGGNIWVDALGRVIE